MKASENPIVAKDFVKRICHTRQAHAEDVSALVKILDWPVGVLEHLMTVLESFRGVRIFSHSMRSIKTSLLLVGWRRI